jgi:hypothetical protein
MFIILAFVCTFANAQDDYRNNEVQTIFAGDNSVGFYGGFSLGYTQIDGKSALISGGRGAVILNHSLALGFAGYGFVNGLEDFDSYNYDAPEYSLAGGYGGLLIEPIAGGLKPVHFSFPVVIGIGGVALVENYGWDYWDYHYPESTEHDIFFVFEPGVELEFNVARFFRTAAAVTYRFTSDVELSGMNQDVLKGLNFKLAFKFGKF